MGRGRAAPNEGQSTAGAPPVGPTPLLLTPLNSATFGGRDVDADVVVMVAKIPAGAPAVTKVDFLVGASIVGTANAAPWQFLWNTTQGSAAVSAKVTYADSTVGTSAVANITIAAPTTAPLPTNCAQVKFWGDPGGAGTVVSGGLVTSWGEFKDGTIVTSFMTQATGSKQVKIGRLRGKPAFAVGMSSTTENYAATLSVSQGFPETYAIVYKGKSQQSVGVLCGTGGTERIGIHGTAWPRNDRCVTSVAVDDAVAHPTAQCTQAVFNNTNSRIRRNGTDIHNPASLGTSGLATSISAPGHSGGASEPGLMGDFVYAQGAVNSTDMTNIDAYLVAKYDLSAPAYRVSYCGDSQTRVFGLTNGGWRFLNHDNVLSRGKICGHYIEEEGYKPEGGLSFYGGDVHAGVDLKGVNYWNTNFATLFGVQFFPDITVMFIGENNAASTTGETFVAGNAAGSTRQAWRDLVTLILTTLPNTKLIVPNLCADPISGTNANVVTLNSTWFADADAAAAALGRTVIHVDVNTALGGPTYSGAPNFQADGHLDNAGCALVSAVMLPAIAEAAYQLANGIA